METQPVYKDPEVEPNNSKSISVSLIIIGGLLSVAYLNHKNSKTQQRPAVPNALELKAEGVEPLIVNCGGGIYTMNFRLEYGVKKQTMPITIGCGRDIITTTAEIGENGAIKQTTIFNRK